MTHALPALLLGICTILGLLLVPFGLPGLWVMVAGIVGYGWLTDFRSVGVATIGTVLGLAFLGEIVEWWLGFRLTRTFGGKEHTSELQSRLHLVCRLLLEKKKKKTNKIKITR